MVDLAHQLALGSLERLALGYVAGNLGSSDDDAVDADRRDGERHVDQPAVFAPADSLVVLDPVALGDLAEDAETLLFLPPLVMMAMIEWPTISSGVKPNIRSAAEFQDITVPVRSLLMMASLDNSTMAAKQRIDPPNARHIHIPMRHQRALTLRSVMSSIP